MKTHLFGCAPLSKLGRHVAATLPRTTTMQPETEEVHTDVSLDLGSGVPSTEEIYEKTKAVFGYGPCLWQVEVAKMLLEKEKDVICIAGTGSGKTLTFWMPLLFQTESIQIVITALNVLGEQNVRQLSEYGIPAIALSAETATVKNLNVHPFLRFSSHIHSLICIRKLRKENTK